MSNQGRKKTQVPSDTSEVILDWYPAETEEFALLEDSAHSFTKWLMCCGPAQTSDRFASYCRGRKQGGGFWVGERPWENISLSWEEWKKAGDVSLAARFSDSCTQKSFHATPMATRLASRGGEALVNGSSCSMVYFGGNLGLEMTKWENPQGILTNRESARCHLLLFSLLSHFAKYI